MGGDEVRLAAASRTGGGERDQGRGEGHGSARRSRRRWPGAPSPLHIPLPWRQSRRRRPISLSSPASGCPLLLPSSPLHNAALRLRLLHLLPLHLSRTRPLLGLRLCRPTPCRRFLLPRVPPLFGVAVSTLPPAAILPRPPPPPLLPVFPLASSSASA